MPVTRAEMQNLWEQVKENHRRLETCPGPHAFRQKSLEGRNRTRFVCTKCQGEIDGSDKWHYDQGLAHGRADREGCIY